MTNTSQSEAVNVLLLAEDFYPKESGGAFIDWNVATHLVSSGNEVTVVTPRNDQTPKTETVNGVHIYRPFRGPPPGTHPNSACGILRRILFVVLVVPYLFYLCYDREFNIVYSTNHIFHPSATIISAVFQLPHMSFVGYSPSIKNTASLLDPLVVLERMNFRWFMRNKALCRTPSVRDLLFQLSTADVVRLDGIVDRGAVEAVANNNQLTAPDVTPDTEIQMIFVGRLVEIKNPTYLPRLIAQLPGGYSLVIVGEGPERSYIESNILKFDVQDRVHLTGRLPHQETLQLIQDSDVLILPSKTESYGAVVFESLSLNTPVLATPVGVLPMINHSNLTLSPIDDFAEILSQEEWESKSDLDLETLERYSVNQFVDDVEKEMFQVTS